MISREISKIIEEAVSTFPVVLLTGPRQVGKSTIIYNKYYEKPFDYISFDDKMELANAINDPRSFIKYHPAPLIIDEAQKCPEIFPEIERVVNESRLKNGSLESNGMYILTGSERKKLLDRSEESLAGRVAIIDMLNLSLNEMYQRPSTHFIVDMDQLSKRSLDYQISEDDLFSIIYRGFFPELFVSKNIKPNIYYSSYISTYIQKDLRDLINISNEIKFLNFLKILASNTGQELIYENYANQVGVDGKTIKSWIDALEISKIVYLLHPYNDQSVVKRITRRPKIYFFDTGLAAYLCGIDGPNTLKNSFLKGRFFETFVINEIRKSYMNEGIMLELYYYRNHNNDEADLVLIRNGILTCIEIKCGQFYNASVTQAFKKIDKTTYVRGKDALICTTDKVSVLNDGTILVPFTVI